MKNLFKCARIAPLMGIIALAVIMGLVMIGCGEVEEEDSITIETDPLGLFTGLPLTAKYSGSITAPVFKWFDSSEGLGASPKGTDKTFIPTAPGSYYVQVGDGKDTTKNKNSKDVIIAQAPSYFSLYGTWKMTGNVDSFDVTGNPVSGEVAKNFTGDDPLATATDFHNETLVISPTKFRLDSTFRGLGDEEPDNPQGGYRVKNNDMDAPNEYLELTISTWEDSTVPTTLPDNLKFAKTAVSDTSVLTWSSAFKGNVTDIKYKGYGSTTGSFITSGISIYYATSGSGAAQKIIIRRASASGTVLTRNYIKQ